MLSIYCNSSRNGVKATVLRCLSSKISFYTIGSRIKIQHQNRILPSKTYLSNTFDHIAKTSFSTSLPPHVVVPMPALSPTMEVGSISKWNLKVGDKFEPGTAICEVETDKATVTFDATEEGYLAKILVGAGEIKVGQPIMVTVEEPESVAAFTGNFSAPSAVPATPVAALAAPPAVVEVAAVTSAPPAVVAGVSSGSRVFASPLARKLAREASMDVSAVAKAVGGGSGPNGRVLAADVLKAAALPRVSPVAAEPVPKAVAAVAPAAPSAPPTSQQWGSFTDFTLSQVSQELAARFAHSKKTVPHYVLSVEVELTAMLALRSQLNATLLAGKKDKEAADVITISVHDMLVKAAALAMKQVPDVNASWMDTFIRRYDQVDINLIMSTGEDSVSPVIRDVAAKGLSTLAKETAQCEHVLFDASTNQPAVDMNTGTFSIHNLGQYGVKAVSPIVLPPQACALGLGAISDTVLPNYDNNDKDSDKVYRVAPVVVATLSCDHRVVDGAVGAQWLAAFKQLVENPLAMMVM